MIIHQKYKYAKLTHLDIQTLKQIYHLKKTCYNIIKRGDTLNRKFKIIIALIALVLCITQIQQTYAKYTESKEGDTDFSIAKWKILVNNNDITESATMSSLINPVYIKNENVKEDVIAPGSEGYFDLVINANQTEVSFEYKISISNSENSSVQDLIITGYTINNSALIPVDNALNNISNKINYKDTNKINTLRVYFKWLDGEGESMDNSADTEASLSNRSAKLKVNLSFIQTKD